jgi:RNA polymerase sigma-70 factor (ECF subfamily)
MEENDLWDRRTGVRSLPASVDVQKAREQLIDLLPRLRRFARALTRNSQDADDLVQVSVQRALARCDQLRLAAHPLSWLLGIASRAWWDELPATRRRRDRALTPEPTETPEAARELLSLQETLARLPGEQHLAVALVLIEGLSYKEAAEIARVPVATLTRHLARARDTLQTLLGGAPGARR